MKKDNTIIVWENTTKTRVDEEISSVGIENETLDVAVDDVAPLGVDISDDNIVDIETFTKNGNIKLFGQEWFTKVFLALQMPGKNYHILSFAQFSYLNIHLNIDFFTSRIVIIRDTLRMLLPISREDFLSYNNGLIVEERRPENMPEYMAEIRKVMADNNVHYQFSELGKVDAGGGGTIAYILANKNVSVIDCGVAVMSMHAPWEITAKADIYEAYKCYKAFLKNM
jgi:hypothetical protein